MLKLYASVFRLATWRVDGELILTIREDPQDRAWNAQADQVIADSLSAFLTEREVKGGVADFIGVTAYSGVGHATTLQAGRDLFELRALRALDARFGEVEVDRRVQVALYEAQ